MNFQKIIFLLAFFSFSIQGSSQELVRVKASVDKIKILIGEQFHLTVEARIPADQPFPGWNLDSIPHFEILEAGVLQESIAGSEKTITREFRLTSFDSGHWVIPAFRISEKYFTDTIPVDVVFSDFDPAKDYHDIKDIIDVNKEKKKKWLWYAIAAGMLLLLLITWFVLRKKKPAVAAVQPGIDPLKEAMEQLEKLQKENLPAKQYFSRLVEIFRFYIFRKKGIRSLQKTTDDLIIQLKDIGLGQEQYIQLSQVLRLSDFVKFAKYVPDETTNKEAFETIKRSVQEIDHIK